MKEWLSLVVLSFVWAIGDILYKKATAVSGELSAERLPRLLVDGVVDVLRIEQTPASLFVTLFAAAMALAFVANLGYSIPLSQLPVSVAKPVLNALTLAFVAILSVVAFNEAMTRERVIGLGFVAVGIWLLSRSTAPA